MRQYTLCTITPGSTYGGFDVKTADGDLPDDYTAFVPVPAGIAAYAAGSGRVDVYADPQPGSPLGAPSSTTTVTGGHDIVVAFQIGDDSYAAGYTSAIGQVTYYATTDGFAPLNTAPMPEGCTTLLPFRTWDDGHWLGGTYLLAYDTNTGTVGTYQLTAEGGEVTATQVWQPAKPWAQGWTRVAPFVLGTANYFLKTNTTYDTVFIDHLMDDADEGSHPAAEHLPLPLDLTAVTTFVVDRDPCFATYLASTGAATFNRFWGDVQGWTEGGSATVVTGGSTAVALPTAEAATVLFY